MRRNLTVLLCFVVLVAGGTACGKKKSNANKNTATTAAATQVTKGDKTSFYLAATPQSGDGKSVKVDTATFTGSKGWVAIHSDNSGAPGPVIGVSKLLDAGTSSSITITLTTPLTASAKVWPMLHLEDNNNTTYDFPNGDAPAKVGTEVVVLPIDITVM